MQDKMSQSYFIREAKQADIPKLKEIYKGSILYINRRDYSPEETVDWASCGDNISRWRELLATHHYFVAEYQETEIVGFSSINGEGYMHSLFVHKDFQRQGIASALYLKIEQYANERGIRRITSEVSITAKPFFERQGFGTDGIQKRKAKKLFLTNYKMSKEIR